MASRSACDILDRDDPLARFRSKFQLPDNRIYLDGNSLGPMPKAALERVRDTLEAQWSQDLITSWNKHGWFTMPLAMGNKIAALIGGGSGNVVVADTISVNLFKLLSAAVALRPERKIILSDSGNFPSDLYVAQGLCDALGAGHRLEIVAPEQVAAAINKDVAAVVLTEVDYRSSRRHDMAHVTRMAHESGCLVIWDLSHSAGAVPVDLLGCNADFAVGCTYKYLNGGPGAPAFLFVHPRHQTSAMPALVGWWGHAAPFAFETDWKAADGIARFQCGTQGVLSMAALDASLDMWRDVDMAAVHAKSHTLCSVFIETVESACAGHGLRLAGPRDMGQRGSHVSFHCDNGYAVMQAMIARGVTGDFRAPDLIRFGFAPLFNTHVEAHDAALVLADVLANRSWDRPEFLARKTVT